MTSLVKNKEENEVMEFSAWTQVQGVQMTFFLRK